MERTNVYVAERSRLLGIATRVLADSAGAEDVVQQAWLRLHSTETEIDNLPAWLTTTTVRLCLDRLRERRPIPAAEVELPGTAPDPGDEVELADAVGVALQVVLDRLAPRERVAFVLHDGFSFEFPAIAALLDTTPAAARKLASRARGKVERPSRSARPADWEVVDAFLTAAREGDFAELLRLLAPDVVVVGDAAAITLGTPERIDGRRAAATFFDGAAAAAVPVFIVDRPGAAWFHRGEGRVVFDFTIADCCVQRIEFRADPEVLANVRRRTGPALR